MGGGRLECEESLSAARGVEVYNLYIRRIKRKELDVSTNVLGTEKGK